MHSLQRKPSTPTLLNNFLTNEEVATPTPSTSKATMEMIVQTAGETETNETITDLDNDCESIISSASTSGCSFLVRQG